MAVLVDIHSQDWMSNEDFRKEIAGLVNEDVRFYPQLGDPQNIRMLVTDKLRGGLISQLSALELIQKLGAGVDTMVALLTGLIIFPIVFAYGLQPGSGPGLIFVTLPIAFEFSLTKLPCGKQESLVSNSFLTSLEKRSFWVLIMSFTAS